MPDFFYVYELSSDRDPTIRYRGVTSDLRRRLDKHNAGSCSYTSKYRPWHIDFAFAFRSEHKGRAFERYLKSGSGREFARRHF